MHRRTTTPRRLAALLAAATLAATTVPAALHAQRGPATVILVRHAEKAAQPAGDPLLSAAGEQRARVLAEALRDAGVDAVVTTQLARTRLTAAPLVAALHLTPTVVATGPDTEAHVRAVAAAVRRQPPGSTVLVVGHSNTVPAIVTALGGPAGPELCDAQYATLHVLTFADTGPPALIRVNFGAPDAPDAAACASSAMQPPAR